MDTQFVEEFGFHSVTCCGYLPQVGFHWLFFALQNLVVLLFIHTYGICLQIVKAALPFPRIVWPLLQLLHKREKGIFGSKSCREEQCSHPHLHWSTYLNCCIALIYTYFRDVWHFDSKQEKVLLNGMGLHSTLISEILKKLSFLRCTW